MLITYGGLNYKNCPLPLREKFASLMDKEVLTKWLQPYRKNLQFIPLSTCNRFEFCILGPLKDPLSFLTQFLGENARSYLHFSQGLEALENLFSVSCSLDSLVVGESQILGQVKQSFQLAKEWELCDSSSESLFQHCFYVAKKVKNQTSLHQKNTSLAKIALEVARERHSQSILILGAGYMGSLIAKYIEEYFPHSSVTLANRTLDKALVIKDKYNLSQAVSLDTALENFSSYSLVFCTLQLNTPLIFEKHTRENQRIFDLGMPRNVDDFKNPEVTLINIDDLKTIAAHHIDSRSDAISQASQIIKDEALSWYTKQNKSPIAEFHSWVKEVTYQELTKAQSKGTQNPEVIAQAIAKKISSIPISQVRKGQNDLLESLRIIFNLEP
jgi:glutamyl-tRNA reductase